MYGKELILDLHDCKNCFLEMDLESFCQHLCMVINMEPCDFHYWKSEPDEEKNPDTFGISAIQFITTSNITVHVLPLKKAVYINLFSCKDFDDEIAAKFIDAYFISTGGRKKVIERE